MISARVHSSDLAKLSEQLGRRKSHVEMAMRRAVGSFVALLRSYVLTEVRRRIGLPQKQMNKVRIKARIVRNKLQASLWVGSNPVAVRYLNPRFTNKGVSTGRGDSRQAFPRAFLPYKKQGRTLILQRVGKERLPVVAPEVEINDVVLEVLDREWSRLEAYFDKRVAAELQTIDRKQK
jgi:hypothetical protein